MPTLRSFSQTRTRASQRPTFALCELGVAVTVPELGVGHQRDHPVAGDDVAAGAGDPVLAERVDLELVLPGLDAPAEDLRRVGRVGVDGRGRVAVTGLGRCGRGGNRRGARFPPARAGSTPRRNAGRARTWGAMHIDGR